MLPVLVLSGCSLKGIVFEHLPWFVSRSIDNYFDLSDSQLDDLRGRLPRHLTWCQQNLIPPLQNYLNQLIALEGEIPADKIKSIYTSAWQLWPLLLDAIAVDGGQLLASLDDRQIGYLQEVLKEHHEDNLAMAHLPDDEFAAAYQDHIEEGLERFEEYTGALSESQRKLYLATASQDQRLVRDQILLREEMRESFIKQWRLNKGQAQALTQLILTWSHAPQIDRPERYQSFSKQRAARSIKILTTMEPTLTPKQRQNRLIKLKEHQSDLAILAKIDFAKKQP